MRWLLLVCIGAAAEAVDSLLDFSSGSGFGDEDYTYYRVELSRWSIELHLSDGTRS